MKSIVLYALFAVSASVYGAHAESTPWVDNEFIKMRLFAADETGCAPENKDCRPYVRGGLEFVLKDGWKIYWRTPGDAGIALTMKTDDSTNLSRADVLWPLPTRYIEKFDLEVWGYEHKLLLPLRLVRAETGAMQFVAKLTYSACNDICVPFNHTVTLDIPETVKPNVQDAKLIDDAMKTVPVDASATTVLVTQKKLDEKKKQLVLEVKTDAVPTDVFIDGVSGFRFPKPSIMKKSARTVIVTQPYESSVSTYSLAGKTIRVTLKTASGGVEQGLEIRK